MDWLTWLKQYSYIAGWLSPAIALIGMLIRGGGAKGVALDWARMMLYIGFLTCLAAVFTPLLDDTTRIFAAAGVVSMSVFFMIQADADGDVRRDIERKTHGLPIQSPATKPNTGTGST